MNVESIIGIIAGIFGIVTGCAWLHGVMKQHAKQKNAYSLLKQIADKNSTDVQRRKILNKLNKNKFVNGRIKESYINKFVLSGKGIEKLLLEICVENEIESTEDLCKKLIDTKGQSFDETNVFITDAKDYVSNGRCFVFDYVGNYQIDFETSSFPQKVISKK